MRLQLLRIVSGVAIGALAMLSLGQPAISAGVFEGRSDVRGVTPSRGEAVVSQALLRLGQPELQQKLRAAISNISPDEEVIATYCMTLLGLEASIPDVSADLQSATAQDTGKISRVFHAAAVRGDLLQRIEDLQPDARRTVVNEIASSSGWALKLAIMKVLLPPGSASRDGAHNSKTFLNAVDVAAARDEEVRNLVNAIPDVQQVRLTEQLDQPITNPDIWSHRPRPAQVDWHSFEEKLLSSRVGGNEGTSQSVALLLARNNLSADPWQKLEAMNDNEKGKLLYEIAQIRQEPMSSAGDQVFLRLADDAAKDLRPESTYVAQRVFSVLGDSPGKVRLALTWLCLFENQIHPNQCSAKYIAALTDNEIKKFASMFRMTYIQSKSRYRLHQD